MHWVIKHVFFKGDSYCILDLKIAEWVLIGAGALNTASMATFFTGWLLQATHIFTF